MPGKQLYPPERLAGMSKGDLERTRDFALSDIEDGTTLYAGMDRAETVATARRTAEDVRAQLAVLAANQLAADHRANPQRPTRGSGVSGVPFPGPGTE